MRNFILSTLSALFLGFIAVGAQNPPQVPGTYYIINSVLSPAGEKLAASIQNSYGNVIVTPLTNSRLQQWMISSVGQNLEIVPITRIYTDVRAQGNNVVNDPSSPSPWTIKNVTATGTYTIAVQSQYWGLNSAVNNADVVLGPETNNPTQRWNFTLIRLGNQ